jgi:hypothetical protein
MPTAIALFAEGTLRPVGGAQVDITVAGKEHAAMVLCEVICPDDGGRHGGRHEIAALVFKPAQPTAVPCVRSTAENRSRPRASNWTWSSSARTSGGRARHEQERERVRLAVAGDRLELRRRES